MTFATALRAALLAMALTAHAADRPENFVQWRDGLASSAQPKAEWLAGAGEQKYEVLVNLAPPQSHGSLANEGGIVGAKGVKYVNIPVDFSRPTAEDFRFFSEVMKASAGRNVFVHCQANFRASSFVFLYRVVHENAPVQETWAKLQSAWVPDRVWRRFVEETLKAHGKSAELL
jgi:protein tyrosine phosphatase (PTP) superfamily phosphohydrolase (DUF442 family)